MAIDLIPLSPIPSQTITVTLSNQLCEITLNQKENGLYFSLISDTKPIVNYIICQNGNYLIRYSYLKFIGDFYFVDMQGSESPGYYGLGQRWILIYEDSP